MENAAALQRLTAPQPTAQNFGHTSTTMIPAGLPIVQGQVTAAGATKDPRSKKNNKSINVFGIAELVMGGMSIFLTIIALSITERDQDWYWRNYRYRWRRYTGFTYASSGIWGGIFVIVAGILAVRVKSNPSRSMYIANMILAIITACVTLSSSVVSCMAAVRSYYSSLLFAIHVMVTLLNFVSMIVTIIHACFCCRGVCCNNRLRSAQNVVYVPAQPNMIYPQQPQCVQGPNGQAMPVYLQQVPAQQYPQRHVPAQQYPQISGSNLVLNTGYQANNVTAQAAPPPTYDNVDQAAAQIETKSTAALND